MLKNVVLQKSTKRSVREAEGRKEQRVGRNEQRLGVNGGTECTVQCPRGHAGHVPRHRYEYHLLREGEQNRIDFSFKLYLPLENIKDYVHSMKQRYRKSSIVKVKFWIKPLDINSQISVEEQ